MTKRAEWLNMGPFPYYVGFCQTEAAFNAVMRRLKMCKPWPQWVSTDAACHSFVSNQGKQCVVICIEMGDHSLISTMALIAHEAVHAMQFMEKDLYPGGRFDDETQAYLVQYITQRCCECLPAPKGNA